MKKRKYERPETQVYELGSQEIIAFSGDATRSGYGSGSIDEGISGSRSGYGGGSWFDGITGGRSGYGSGSIDEGVSGSRSGYGSGSLDN
ncbi:MAG: hypothetical protein IJ064_07410 [Bacteroidaceae bacterium]|nr:hypothetical protein [Bacteroidaceae bacterium]